MLYICIDFWLLACKSRDLSQLRQKSIEQINLFSVKIVRFERNHHFEQKYVQVVILWIDHVIHEQTAKN